MKSEVFNKFSTGKWVVIDRFFSNFAPIMRKLEVFDMRRMSVEEFRRSEKTPLTVVLDNVRSMHNVGSVLRTADAFRVERVLMCGITSTPPHPELHKTALGAEDSVEWQYEKSTLDAVRRLKAEGYRVCAIEQCEGSVMMDSFEAKPDTRYAVVFGNEVHGVQQEVVDECDECIEIPQFGTKHSLNVSVTAGIVIWEFARRLMLTCALLLSCVCASAQEIIDNTPLDLDNLYKVMPTWHMMKKPEFYDGEWIPVIVLPEIPVYKPMVFRNDRERKRYDKLVRNVKRVLPMAKMIRMMVIETYETLEKLPPEERDAHLKQVEKDIKKQYTPEMKKLTFSQGKLLIKLVDRECSSTSYKIVQAFLGQTRAFFYQVFAWTLGASLKKHYDPEGDDREIERIVRQVEVGAL